MYDGWHQVAFERELNDGLTPVAVGPTRLILWYSRGQLRAFDRYCPHRGADLAGCSVRDERHVVCPFHGRQIGLGCPGENGFGVREYGTLLVGGLAFVLTSPEHDCGLAEFLRALDQTHYFVPGFSLPIRTSPEVVIENAFDRRHFKQVHGLDEVPELRLATGAAGELLVESRFRTAQLSDWQAESPAPSPGEFGFLARVFSPALCVTELRVGESVYCVITAATADQGGGCQVRVSLAVPAGAGGSPPAVERVRALLRDSRTSLEQDQQVWESLAPEPPFNLVAGDEPIGTYYQFCQRFARGPVRHG